LSISNLNLFMNKSSRLLILSWITFSSPLLQADPALVIPPGNLSCSVVVTNHAGAPVPLLPSSAPVPPRKPGLRPSMTAATIERVGGLQHTIFSWSNGSNSEMWILLDKDLALLEDASGQGKSIFELPRGSAVRKVLSPPMLDLDAESLAWINSQNLTGKAAYKGKSSLHYQATQALYNFIPPRQVLYQAWIDPKTLLPLAMDDGDNLYELTFAAPPSEPLVLPDRFKKNLQEYYNANAVPRHL
jgi:hypothetical protein